MRNYVLALMFLGLGVAMLSGCTTAKYQQQHAVALQERDAYRAKVLNGITPDPGEGSLVIISEHRCWVEVNGERVGRSSTTKVPISEGYDGYLFHRSLPAGTGYSVRIETVEGVWFQGILNKAWEWVYIEEGKKAVLDVRIYQYDNVGPPFSAN